MCQGSTHSFLAALPKCEHHMHIEGSLSPSLLFRLAKRNNITLPKDDPAFESPETLLKRYESFANLDDFLHYYFIGMSTLMKESDFQELAWEYFLQAKKDGVMHAELFFDPQGHYERGISYQTIVDGFSKAGQRAQTELNISNELLVCFLRHLPAKDAMDNVYSVAMPDLISGRVKGIGLSSSEKGNPPSLFQDIYKDAEKRGIRRTAHAGEEADVDYMRQALELCKVQRMDHGIKLTEDPSFMKLCAERKIMVTMCPLSNVRLRCVTDVSELPIPQYLEAGVSFSLNSDDPAYFGGYILDNYCAVQKAFNLKVEQWETIVRNSVIGSWCSEQRKEEILTKLSEVVKQHSL